MNRKSFRPIGTSLLLASSLFCFGTNMGNAATLENKDVDSPTSIHLDNVRVYNIFGSSIQTAATLIATDDQPIHEGQVFQAAATGGPYSIEDAVYDEETGDLQINFLLESATKLLHHVKLQQSGSAPLRFTIVDLFNHSDTSGEPGPVGATGPAGPAGPAGIAGAVGPAGPAGPAGIAGAVGPAGPAGPAGADGAMGPAGPAGIAGATGPAGSPGATGPAGSPGATGPAGEAGLAGAVGPQGVQGIPGEPGSGAIIPFASGNDPSIMTTIAGGLSGTGSVVSFGNNDNGVSIDGAINATEIGNHAFMVPRSGTITSMSAFTSLTAPQNLIATTVTITAQLYSSTAPDNIFTPIPGASVIVAPSLTGLLSIGDVSSGLTTGLSIPIAVGERLLVVFSSTSAGVTLITTVAAHTSAGISIN